MVGEQSFELGAACEKRCGSIEIWVDLSFHAGGAARAGRAGKGIGLDQAAFRGRSAEYD